MNCVERLIELSADIQISERRRTTSQNAGNDRDCKQMTFDDLLFRQFHSAGQLRVIGTQLTQRRNRSCGNGSPGELRSPTGGTQKSSLADPVSELIRCILPGFCHGFTAGNTLGETAEQTGTAKDSCFKLNDSGQRILACRRESGERFCGQIKHVWRRVIFFCESVEQIGHIIPAIQGPEIPFCRRESRDQPSLCEEVQTAGRLANKDYATPGKQVNSSIKRAFESFGPFRQRRDLSEFSAEQCHHSAGFAEVGQANHNGFCFFE